MSLYDEIDKETVARLMGLNTRTVFFRRAMGYPKLEKENATLKADLAQVKEDCNGALAAKDREMKAKSKGYEGRLAAKDIAFADTTRGYIGGLRERDTRIKGLQGEKEQLIGHLKELTKVKDDLKAKLKMKRDQLMKEPETKKEIDDEVASLKKEWEEKEKPKEVDQAALDKLTGVLVELRGPSETAPTVPAGDLKQMVKQMIEGEVNRRMDEKFEARVETEKNKRVSEIIEEVKQKEWEKWYNEKVVPLANQLDQEFRTNVLSRLMVPWPLTCLAGHQNTHTFSADEWDELVRTGRTKFACGQSGCLQSFVGALTGIEVRSSRLIQVLFSSAESHPPQRDQNSVAIF